MPLHGYVILIVEPDVTSFVSELQDAIERGRGESIAGRSAAALARCAKFQFSAALVNSDHGDIVGKLMMPVVLYQPQEGHRSVLTAEHAAIGDAAVACGRACARDKQVFAYRLSGFKLRANWVSMKTRPPSTTC